MGTVSQEGHWTTLIRILDYITVFPPRNSLFQESNLKMSEGLKIITDKDVIETEHVVKKKNCKQQKIVIDS